MSTGILLLSKLDEFNLVLVAIVAAASFGTILGIGAVYLLMQGEVSVKVQAVLLIFLLLAGSYIVTVTRSKNIKLNQRHKSPRDSNISSSHSHSTFTTKNTAASGLHALEGKYLKDKSITKPFSKAVADRIEGLGLNKNIYYSKEENDEYSKEEFYKSVYGRCCESVIGEIFIPVGVVGPIPLISESENTKTTDNIFVPMATVEGALVASVNRGCKALRLSYEADPNNLMCVMSNRRGMTRGPCIKAPNIVRAAAFLKALEDARRFEEWQGVFNASSPGRHVELVEIRGKQIGKSVYLRIRGTTSEAMGMNMLSRGTEQLISYILKETEFADCELVALSGNYCVDKKPAAINWIEGRGVGVVASVLIPREVLKQVLGVEDAAALVRLNTSKNLIGSAAAGSVGGFNAQVANVVAAIYLATGQDVAQVVDAAQAMTLLEEAEDGGVLASLTMSCIEVGIRGGGTELVRQKNNLALIKAGLSVDELARCVCLTALAGELSLLAALLSGTLVQSHFKLNHRN